MRGMGYVMKYINKNLHRGGKNSLCIGTDELNINNLPTILKKYISDAIINNEKVIFFTDNIFSNNIEKNSNDVEKFIADNKNKDQFEIKPYNIAEFDYDCKVFLEIIDIIFVSKQKLRVIWDFKNVIKRDSKLESVIKCVQKIIDTSKDNVSNMVYIYNNVYKYNKLCNFSDLFQTLIIIDRNKEMEFTNKKEIEKAIWMLQSNSLLIYQNEIMQNRLIQNEKLRAMGEMAAGITHDINNILTPIVGSVQLLRDTIKEKENLKLLNVIEICAYDGINIANKVKRLTEKYNNEDLEIFNIDSVISDAIDLTKSKWLTGSIFKGIKIDIIRELKSNEVVLGNITEIREVFINIIGNAIEAMPVGGVIEIITKNKASKAVIEIRDNGMGMSKEIQKRIFEPFFTTKGNNGSGLGLSISYNIILSLKGSMKIESEENVGTSFIVKLPICEKLIKKSDDILNREIDFEGNILVIDDQEQIRTVVSSMIKSIAKCKIKTCGCDNLDSELKRRKYDIIVCDFTMPSINGFQVARKIKEINKNTYFCLMTGWVGSFEDQEMINVDFVLNKPINKDSLKKMFFSYNIKQ